HRVQHTHRGTKEGAIPADRRISWRKPRHPSGGRVCECSRGSERELVRRPRPRTIRLLIVNHPMTCNRYGFPGPPLPKNKFFGGFEALCRSFNPKKKYTSNRVTCRSSR